MKQTKTLKENLDELIAMYDQKCARSFWRGYIWGGFHASIAYVVYRLIQ